MATNWPPKTTTEYLDYVLNWAARLGSDTITQSVWSVAPTGLTIGDQSFTTTTATVWLGGGERNKLYRLTNRVTTAAGRIMEETVTLQVL
jgi:hypothetical protein